MTHEEAVRRGRLGGLAAAPANRARFRDDPIFAKRWQRWMKGRKAWKHQRLAYPGLVRIWQDNARAIAQGRPGAVVAVPDASIIRRRNGE